VSNAKPGKCGRGTKKTIRHAGNSRYENRSVGTGTHRSGGEGENKDLYEMQRNAADWGKGRASVIARPLNLRTTVIMPCLLGGRGEERGIAHGVRSKRLNKRPTSSLWSKQEKKRVRKPLKRGRDWKPPGTETGEGPVKTIKKKENQGAGRIRLSRKGEQGGGRRLKVQRNCARELGDGHAEDQVQYLTPKSDDWRLTGPSQICRREV